MWIIFGVLSIIALALNLIFYITNRNAEIFRFVSISCTALTVCAFYSQTKEWVIKEDWSALMDVTPTTSTILWILVIISVFINGISLIKRENKITHILGEFKMKQKHWKIISLLMLIMAVGFTVAVVLGHSDTIPTATICAGAALATYAASKRVN